MKKKIKIGLIILTSLVGLYFIIQFLLIKAGEYVLKTEILNAEEIAGKTDNNSYGIRNDVYDVIQKEYFEKMNLSEEEKIMTLNIAYLKQNLIANYHNEKRVLENLEKIMIIIECNSEKNQFLSVFLNNESLYSKTFLNTENRRVAKMIYERIYVKNSSKVRQAPNSKEECLLFKKILKE